MPQYTWIPEQLAGGINLFEDASSLPNHQLVQCDNYYPNGKRWKLIQGNTALITGTAVTKRIRHLSEYQHDNGSLGTDKFILSWHADGKLYEDSSGTPTEVTYSTPFTTSQTMLWDTTVFQGVMLMVNGTDGSIYETTNGTSYTPTAGSSIPTAPQCIEGWKNRVFVGGRAAAPLTVYFCAFGDRTTWTGTDTGTEIVTTPVGDYITAIKSVENYLAIFTRRTITLLIGNHPDNWIKRTAYEDHGCSSWRTVAKINGGIVYANDFGVWAMDAQGNRMELSRDIRPYWQNEEGSASQRNKARSKFMHAVYDPTPNNNRYCIWVAEGTSTKENVCWIFHFNQNGWSRMTKFLNTNGTCQASCLREDTNGNIEVYFAAGTDDNTTTDKNIYYIGRNTFSFASLTGGNIAATLKSGIIHGIYQPFYQQFDIATVKKWKEIFIKYTDAPATGNLTVAIANCHKALLTAQKSINVPYSGTGNIARERVPIGLDGWGIQVTVSKTGTAQHDFLGGILDYDNVGSI